MKSLLRFSIGLLVLGLITAHGQPDSDSRTISDADLIHCQPVYCPGSAGMTGKDTRAKLAIIKIWRGKNPKEHLLKLYPECSREGKAYVLAALWHFDHEAFKRLAIDFAQNTNSIEVMSADMGWSQTPVELLGEMQKTNSTLAFQNPPLTREERTRIAHADDLAHYEAFKETAEWKKARAKYKLGFPDEAMMGWDVEILPKQSKIAFIIDWNWEESGGGWHPTVPIDDITAAVEEINGAPFLQEINERTDLNIFIDTESGNFYWHGPEDDSDKPQENKEANLANILAKASGYSGTNQLIKITARCSDSSLELWHPFHSHFWLITWNLRRSPAWCDAYKAQTGLELTNTETASGWAASCDNDGVLKMAHCPEAKTIEERVKEEEAARAAQKIK